MESLVLISLFLLVVFSFLIWQKQALKFEKINELIVSSFLLILTIPGFDNQNTGLKFISFIIAVLTCKWLLDKFVNQKLKIFVSIISILSLFLWKNVTISFLGYPIILDLKNAGMIPILSLFLFGILYLLNKFVKSLDNEILKFVEILGIGFILLLSFIFSGAFGIFIFGISYTCLKWDDDQNKNFQLPILFIGILIFLFKFNEIPSDSILQGSGLIGLFFGFGIFQFLNNISTQDTFYKKVLYLILAILISTGIVFLEKIKEHTGGFNALLGISLFFILSFNYLKRENKNLWISFVLFLLFLFYSFKNQTHNHKAVVDSKSTFENFEAEIENLNEISENTIDTTKQINTKILKKDSVIVENPLHGIWKITELSKIKFELGPTDARTQGEFQLVEGNLIFDENILNNKINVELPLTKFTTYNDYRDETLMEKEFLHKAIQEVLTFNSVKWKKQGNNFQVLGDFKMKNIAQKIPINLKIVGFKDKKQTLLISGTSSLDRTKFDMSSDPKIGDIIDFSYQLILKKQD